MFCVLLGSNRTLWRELDYILYKYLEVVEYDSLLCETLVSENSAMFIRTGESNMLEVKRSLCNAYPKLVT